MVMDEAKDVRKGEELDQQKLQQFLREQIPGLEGELEILQFPSGHSNLTYLIRVGEREMVLRRPPKGTKAQSAHDMSREYKMLNALYPVYPYVPKPLVYTEDEDILGSSFYVMERLQGIILRKEPPEGMEIDYQTGRELCKRLVESLVELHSIDYKSIGLEDFGKPAGYVERQVKGWNKRYRNAKTPDVPDFEETMNWLEKNMPPESDKVGIIHNDFKFDNLVLDPQDPLKIVGILDWEMATIGDPLMDLAGTLGYWVQADDPEDMQMIRSLPTNYPGMFSRQEFVDYYAHLTGQRIDNFDFYLCFGYFRLAVIAQQIYYRFYHGQTQDERFKQFSFVVACLEKACSRIVQN